MAQTNRNSTRNSKHKKTSSGLTVDENSCRTRISSLTERAFTRRPELKLAADEAARHEIHTTAIGPLERIETKSTLQSYRQGALIHSSCVRSSADETCAKKLFLLAKSRKTLQRIECYTPDDCYPDAAMRRPDVIKNQRTQRFTTLW